MSSCYSVIHPSESGGCPSGDMTPEGCYCDCHSECADCDGCSEEFEWIDLHDNGHDQQCKECRSAL